MVLWIEWMHQGRLVSDAHSTLFTLTTSDVVAVTTDYIDVFCTTVAYARRYVEELRLQPHPLDIVEFDIIFNTSDNERFFHERSNSMFSDRSSNSMKTGNTLSDLGL